MILHCEVQRYMGDRGSKGFEAPPPHTEHFTANYRGRDIGGRARPLLNRCRNTSLQSTRHIYMYSVYIYSCSVVNVRKDKILPYSKIS